MPVNYLTGYATGGAAARPDSFSGLDPRFAQSLAELYRAAPDNIRSNLQITSAYRSPQVQQELWDNAVRQYGSEAAARKWVAPPGNSKHNSGTAIDFRYGNDAARQWAHQNATKFNLAFPLSHEPWHVEPAWARGVASAFAPQQRQAPAMNAITQNFLSQSSSPFSTNASGQTTRRVYNADTNSFEDRVIPGVPAGGGGGGPSIASAFAPSSNISTNQSGQTTRRMYDADSNSFVDRVIRI